VAFSIVCPTKKPALVGESLRKSLVLLRKVVPYTRLSNALVAGSSVGDA